MVEPPYSGLLNELASYTDKITTGAKNFLSIKVPESESVLNFTALAMFRNTKVKKKKNTMQHHNATCANFIFLITMHD